MREIQTDKLWKSLSNKNLQCAVSLSLFRPEISGIVAICDYLYLNLN